MKLRFIVEGMTCAVCSASVEKVVGRVSGVRRAAVNLSAKTLLCDCEKGVLPEEIIRKIEGAGFTAVLENDAPRRTESNVKAELIPLGFSAVLLLPLMYLSMGEMLGLPLPAALARQSAPVTHAILQLCLTVFVLLINFRFFTRGLQAVRRGSANMDTLVSLGSAAAFLYSVVEIVLFLVGQKPTLGALYLESSAMILTLVTFGKFLEGRAKDKTASALHALNELAPESVCVLRDGRECTVSPEEIVAGDLVLVRPGERIAVDGTVAEGESTLDTSTLTGESLPQDVSTGMKVLSGSINLSGALVVCAEKSVGDSTLLQMIALVEEAGVTRAPAARLADKVASVFVPVVCSIALFVTVLWLCLGYGLGTALGFGISVLVVSCPCALGLATPVAITAALGKCASRGVLVRSAAAFDQLVACDTILLDKTGTITRGAPTVTDVFPLCEKERLLTLAASLEEPSEHPLARAVCRFADGERKTVSDFRAEFGRGVEALCEGRPLFGGNAAFLSDHGVDVRPLEQETLAAQKQGKTVVYFAYGTELLGALALSDELKETATSALDALRKQGLETIMLTGDRAACAEAVAEQCGITRVIAEVLPQGKEAQVRLLQEQGRRVAMVGDGVNDAAALLRSEIGVSVGNGTDIAQNAADVILLYNDLCALPQLFSYARRVRRVIRQNLFWAFFYNCCMIPIAAGALYVPLAITLSPMIAAACMSVSSLFVVTNALRLYRGKESK